MGDLMENGVTTQLISKITANVADKLIEMEKKKNLKRFYDKKTMFDWLVKTFAEQEGVRL